MAPTWPVIKFIYTLMDSQCNTVEQQTNLKQHSKCLRINIYVMLKKMMRSNRETFQRA